MTSINPRLLSIRRPKINVRKRVMKEAKGLLDFERRAKVSLGASKETVLNKAKSLLYALEKINARPEKVLVVFPMTKQGGNFYFAQGLFKVLAPKVRVVSLLTTGHAEHEKTIAQQFKNLLRGRSKVIVFDDRNMGFTESNIRSALFQNGIERENISYNNMEPNQLGSKMSAFVQRKKPFFQGIQLLALDDANLIKLMYLQTKGIRTNTSYSEWMKSGKVRTDINEYTLDKMHEMGLLTKEVISKSELELYDKVGGFDPIFIDQKTKNIVPTKEALKRVFEIIPRERINAVVKSAQKEEAKFKRIEYLKGVAAANEVVRERAGI